MTMQITGQNSKDLKRAMNRALQNPKNKWAWYECFKAGLKLEDALQVAFVLAIPPQPIQDGFKEYQG